jgi:hypothetical protein
MFLRQIRSHAQKYFLKVQKNGTGEHLPPPRPKRKAAHPYPQKAPKSGLYISTTYLIGMTFVLTRGNGGLLNSCSISNCFITTTPSGGSRLFHVNGYIQCCQECKSKWGRAFLGQCSCSTFQCKSRSVIYHHRILKKLITCGENYNFSDMLVVQVPLLQITALVA